MEVTPEPPGPPEPRDPPDPSAEQARRVLDGHVVAAELTLISIIQGIAFSLLLARIDAIDAWARPGDWPAVVTSLLTVLLFWSRALIHVLTVIRWPLEFTHNFLYVAATLVQSLAFAQIGSAWRWHAGVLAFALFVGWLYVADLRMVRRRRAEARGPVARALLARIEEDQRWQARRGMPLLVAWLALATVATWAIRLPWGLVEAFFGWGTLVGAVVWLVLTMRLWRELHPQILAARIEEARDGAGLGTDGAP